MPTLIQVAGIAGLGVIGGAVGVVIGGAVGGPIGMAVGAAVGVVIGVGVGVVAYLVSRAGRIEVERAEIAQERARLVEEEAAFDPEPEPEVELAPRAAAPEARITRRATFSELKPAASLGSSSSSSSSSPSSSSSSSLASPARSAEKKWDAKAVADIRDRIIAAGISIPVKERRSFLEKLAFYEKLANEAKLETKDIEDLKGIIEDFETAWAEQLSLNGYIAQSVVSEKQKVAHDVRIAPQQPTQELKADKKAIQQEERKVEACEMAIDSQKKKNEKEEKTIDQNLIERKEIAAFIDDDIVRVGIEKINAVKNVVDLMLRANMPLEQIKSVVKASFKSIHLFFEDELRDPVTDELLLDDCVLGSDGRHYNRSTMVNVYGKNPAELKTDEAFLAKLQLFQNGGSSEALSLYSPGSPAPVSEECVSEGSEESEEPSTRINKVTVPSQAGPSKNKTFLKAPAGYCALFFPRQKVATPTPGKKPHPLDIGIVVERQATPEQEQAMPEVVI